MSADCQNQHRHQPCQKRTHTIRRCTKRYKPRRYNILFYQKDISQLVPSLTINDTEIERVNTFNFLGITLDENVTWKPPISILSNKISKYSWILNRLKYYLPLHIMRILYCRLVNSHILYGILVGGYECHRLEKI